MSTTRDRVNVLTFTTILCVIWIPGIQAEEPLDSTDTNGTDHCILLHDDVAETFFAVQETIADGVFLQKFTPAFSPFHLTRMFVGLTQGLGTSDRLSFGVVLFDDDGFEGSPGTLLGYRLAEATGIPAWPGIDVFEIDLVETLPYLDQGSFFIGVGWNGTTADKVGIGANFLHEGESQEQIFFSKDGGTTWFDVSAGFPSVRGLFITPCGAPVRPLVFRDDFESGICRTWTRTSGYICGQLQSPSGLSIDGLPCGGSTPSSSPIIQWLDISHEVGYWWEIVDESGSSVYLGTSGANVCLIIAPHLGTGDYSVRVRARGDGFLYGDSSWSDDCPFTIDNEAEVEVADFTYWPELPKAGERVRFADLSSGNAVAWVWDFGDGSVSHDQHPDHIFEFEGRYPVILDVRFFLGGEDSTVKLITVEGEVVCGDRSCDSPETAWSCPSDCALGPP